MSFFPAGPQGGLFGQHDEEKRTGNLLEGYGGKTRPAGKIRRLSSRVAVAEDDVPKAPVHYRRPDVPGAVFIRKLPQPRGGGVAVHFGDKGPGSRPQDAPDFREPSHGVGPVFDGVDTDDQVETLGGKGDIHGIAELKAAIVKPSLFFHLLGGPDLSGRVIDAGNRRRREGSGQQQTHGSRARAYIEDLYGGRARINFSFQPTGKVREIVRCRRADQAIVNRTLEEVPGPGGIVDALEKTLFSGVDTFSSSLYFLFLLRYDQKKGRHCYFPLF